VFLVGASIFESSYMRSKSAYPFTYPWTKPDICWRIWSVSRGSQHISVELYAQQNCVSVHIPLNQTRHILN